MVFGGIWKECDQSGSSIRLNGGICAHLVYLQLVFQPHSHVNRQKKTTKKRVSVVAADPTPALNRGKASLSLECSRCMEQICSFQRLAIISKSNISGRTINGAFRRSLCIPPILKPYDFLRDKNPISNNGIHHCLSGFMGVFSICRCLPPPPLTVILTSSSWNCSLADSSPASPLGSCQHLLIKS